MNANVVARQQAQQQLSENEMVLKVRRARSRRVDFFPLTTFSFFKRAGVGNFGGRRQGV